MSYRKLEIIRPSLDLVRLSDGDLLLRARAVLQGVFNTPAYSNPPIFMEEFKAALDALASAITATLDGGRAATVARDACRNQVIIMLRQLGYYVEVACKNDMHTFVLSGFMPALLYHRTPEPSVPPDSIRLDHGQSGQLIARIQPVKKARRYDLRYAVVPQAGGEPVWATVLAGSTKPPIRISNLTPGQIYMFQARVFGQLGLSEWSNTFQRMCT
jgi:hypothetical protein